MLSVENVFCFKLNDFLGFNAWLVFILIYHKYFFHFSSRIS